MSIDKLNVNFVLQVKSKFYSEFKIGFELFFNLVIQFGLFIVM